MFTSRLVFLCCFAVSLATDFVCKVPRDTVRIGFGSCNNPFKNQSIWNTISAQTPDVWLFTGDAVYTRNTSLVSLYEAYGVQQKQDLYRSFLKTLTQQNVRCTSVQSGKTLPHPMFGVYDDHDYGINDVGSSGISYRQDGQDKMLRMYAFESFIGSTPILQDSSNQPRLYKSITIQSSKSSMKVIFLDTRTYRQDYYLPSMGNFGDFPLIGMFFAPFGALVRAICGHFGLVNHDENAMLGQEQWEWFKQELATPEPFTIIVSSIQVTTSNPLVESWGHFPTEKQQLLKLISESNASVLIVSGDVHFAEFLGLADKFNEDSVLEVTSSGLTHTCKGNVGPFCSLINNFYYTHRRPSNAAYAIDLNFGILDVELSSKHKTPSFNASVISNSGDVLLSLRRAPEWHTPIPDHYEVSFALLTMTHCLLMFATFVFALVLAHCICFRRCVVSS